jgi:periodic tryptophan protein 2
MINYKFTNLFGVTYNSGNIQFSSNNPDLLYSPIGNKVTVFDIKNGGSKTLDIEARSNIHLIDITKKSLLISIDVNGYCILVNLIKNVVIGYFNFHEKAHSLKSSPCGNFICIGIKNGVQIYELPKFLTKQIEPLVFIKSYTGLHSDAVKSITWSNDSRFVLTGSKDNSVRLLNLFKIEGYSPFIFTGHKKKIINAFFSEDNSKIFTISADGVLFIWKYIDEKSEEFIERSKFNNKIRNQYNLKPQNYSSDMLIDEEDNQSILNNDPEKEINYNNRDELYTDFENMIKKGRYILEKKQQFIIQSKITKAMINNKTNILLIALENGIFSIYDLQTLDSKYTLQISDNKINTISISTNGLWLAFGSRKNEQLLVWEWKSESYVFKNQGHNFDVSCIALSSDSSVLTSGGNDGRIKVWDTSTTACICTFSFHTSKVTDIKFPILKTNLFVSSSLDGTVRAYDLVKQVNFRTMTTPEPAQLNCVAIDHIGEIVCAGAVDPYSIYVWNLKTGDIVDILSGHSGPISCLVFSISKDLLISGSWDKTVRTWSIYSKRGDYESFDINSEVLSIDLSPDNKEFSACNIKGEIYTWDIENGMIKSKFYFI